MSGFKGNRRILAELNILAYIIYVLVYAYFKKTNQFENHVICTKMLTLYYFFGKFILFTTISNFGEFILFQPMI